jgi:hypothetical protein
MRIDLAYCLVCEQLSEDADATISAVTFRGESNMLPPSVNEAAKWCSRMMIKQIKGIFELAMTDF